MLPEEGVEVEELLPRSSGSHNTARRGLTRLVAVGAAAGLLVLVGLLALTGWGSLHSGGGKDAAPTLQTQPPVLEEEESADQAAKAPAHPSQAVARLGWEAGDISGAMDLVKGHKYWVHDRHHSGWTYAYDYNYTAHGWVPDSLLYHGRSVVVRKDYENKGISVKAGDYVWVLDKQTQKRGPTWAYVLAGDSFGWIDDDAIKSDDHPNPCLVKKDFKVEDAGQLDLTKGEVVFATEITDTTASWVSVENSGYNTGYVPRKHLIEQPPQPVLQTFGPDEEASSKEKPPKPVLHVKEGDEVWVDSKHTPATPHFLYAFLGDQEGFVPEWALLDVMVDGKETVVGTGEGEQPDDSAKDASHDAEKDAEKEGVDSGVEGPLPAETTEPDATTKEPSATTEEAATTEAPATTQEPATTKEPETDKEPDADKEEANTKNTTTVEPEKEEAEEPEKDDKEDDAKEEE